ncbi:MAG: discoidin domain-containing protein [Verrucomicrobia bacterium]|nr:discoidin domain-containing protein [Verrucomicrobiota bacterium]
MKTILTSITRRVPAMMAAFTAMTAAFTHTVLPAIVLMAACAAHAWGDPLFSVQFGPKPGGGPVLQIGDEALAAAYDAAYIGTSPTWNMVTPTTGNNGPDVISATGLVDRNGGLMTIDFSTDQAVHIWGESPTFPDGTQGVYCNNMAWGPALGTTATLGWQISGLTPSAPFKLVVYGMNQHWGADVTVDTNGSGSLDVGDSTQAMATVGGHAYNNPAPIYFTGTVAADGIVRGRSVRFAGNPGAGFDAGMMGGFQLSLGAAPAATHDITASAETGGSISPVGVLTVAENATPTYTITADLGYDIDQVLVDNINNPAAVTSGTYMFDPVIANHTIKATFVAVPDKTITASTGDANGTISPSGDVPVQYKANQTFTITPNPTYVRDTVLVDDINDPAAVASGSYTFTNVTGNHTILATFAPVPPGMIPGVTIAGVSPNGQGGNRTAIHAVDNSGMSDAGSPTFAGGTHGNVAEDGSGAYMWQSYQSPGTTTWIKFDLGTSYFVDKIHVWNFNEGANIGSKSVNISYSADNVTYSTPVNYTFDAADGTSADPGKIYSLAGGGFTARYVKFDILSTIDIPTASWCAGGLSEVRFNSAPPPAATYDITSSAGTGGSINPDGVQTVAENATPTYTITADLGYDIAKVLVDGTNNPAAVASGTYTFDPVTADHTIEATFVAMPDKTITASTGDANGTISPSGPVAVQYKANQTFTITPNPGYLRYTVMVDGSNVPSAVDSGTYTFNNVTADHTIMATFVPVPPGMIPGVTVIAWGSDSHFPGNDRRAIHLVDNSGMSDAASPTFDGGFAGNQANAPTYPESQTIGYMWQGNKTPESGGPANCWLVFDLGASYPVDKIHVWNFNEPGGSLKSGAKSVDISYSADNVTYSTPVNYTFDIATGLTDYAGQIVTLADGGFNARYVRFDCLNSWGAWTDLAWDAVGLAEVRFNYASGAASNYATWAAAQTPPMTEGADHVGPDGLRNLLIYALAGLKTDHTNGSPGTLSGKTVSFLKRLEAFANGDVSYTIQASDDLGVTDPWHQVTATSNTATEITYLLPDGKPQTFARLVVTQGPYTGP